MSNAGIDPYTPIKVARFGNKDLECETSAGAAWLSKYLHPPAERNADLRGMPDENNLPSIFQEHRLNTDIAPSTAGGTTQGILFLQTSIPGYPILYRHIVDGSFVPGGDYFGVVKYPSFDVRSNFANTTGSRLNYQSVTYELDTTAFTNNGIVTVAQFRPNVEYAPEEIVVGAETFIRNYLNLEIGDLPKTGAEVSMISPKAFSTTARDGAFVIQRMSQPTNSYKETPIYEINQTSHRVTTDYPPVVRVTSVSMDFETYFIASQPGLTAMAPSDFTWSWVLFENISTPVNVKCISGYEMSISTSSTYAPFAVVPATFDLLAIQAATRATHCMQDGMPAAMNSLGSFVTPMIKYAPMVVTALAPMLKQAYDHVSKSILNRPKQKPKKKVVEANPSSSTKVVMSSQTKPPRKLRRDTIGNPVE
jgi:hypothetical protein